MPPLDQPYGKGQRILAGDLNRTHGMALRVSRLHPGIPGGGIPPQQHDPAGEIPIIVIARSVTGPAAIYEHFYTVTDGFSSWEIRPGELIVRVEHGLLGFDGPPDPDNPPMGFAPADVAGEGVAVDYPWRAQGTLYRFPGADGVPAYAVDLFGLAPARGC